MRLVHFLLCLTHREPYNRSPYLLQQCFQAVQLPFLGQFLFICSFIQCLSLAKVTYRDFNDDQPPIFVFLQLAVQNEHLFMLIMVVNYLARLHFYKNLSDYLTL